MEPSHCVRAAGGVSVMLLKYSAKNWPVPHVPVLPPGSIRATKAFADPVSAPWYGLTVGYAAEFVVPVRNTAPPGDTAMPPTNVCGSAK